MARILYDWVDELYVTYNAATHAKVPVPGVHEQAQSIRIEHVENSAALIQIVIPNPGVGLLSGSRRRFVLISETETDDPADAILVARGRVTGLPSELQDVMVTVEAVCAPEDLEDRLKAKAVEVYGAPWSDRLFGDKPEDVVAALNARGATWFIDPVTHEVSITDILRGGRVVDIAHNHSLEDFTIKPGDAPVKSAKMQVSIDWEQAFDGDVDIADSIPRIKLLVGEGGTPEVNINTGAGWEALDNTFRVVSEAPVSLERGYERTRIHEGYQFSNSAFNRAGSFGTSIYRHYFTRLADLEERLTRLDGIAHRVCEFVRFWVRFKFRQQRRETITLIMQAPVQDVLGAVAELDMGILVLDDPTDDLDTPVWYAGMPVVDGDHVLFDGKRWLATETHDRSYFYFKSVLNGALVSVTTPGFEPAADMTALDRASPKLVGTARGSAVIEHALMLMQAALRWRLRGLQVIVRPNDWATVRDLTLDDEMACSHPRFGNVQGKVIKWTRTWAGTGRFATVELGVPLGTGVSDAGDVGGVKYSVAAGPVVEPVVASGLASRLYSVMGVDIGNDADEQSVLAAAAVAAGIDPINVIANNPTSVTVGLRDLTTVRLIERKIAVTAHLADSPKGFDTGV